MIAFNFQLTAMCNIAEWRERQINGELPSGNSVSWDPEAFLTQKKSSFTATNFIPGLGVVHSQN